MIKIGKPQDDDEHDNAQRAGVTHLGFFVVKGFSKHVEARHEARPSGSAGVAEEHKDQAVLLDSSNYHEDQIDADLCQNKGQLDALKCAERSGPIDFGGIVNMIGYAGESRKVN